jgi:hypothetical protein
MTKPDVLFTIELLEEDKCSITFTTSEDVGSYLERLLKEGLFNRDLIENMIQDEYNHFYPSWPKNDDDDDYDDHENDDPNCMGDIEEMENDKRVMEQYDPDYFEFLEWIKYQKSLGVPGLDADLIERLWKLHNIRKIMRGK